MSTPGVYTKVTVRHRGTGVGGRRCLVGQDCKKALSIYPQSVLPARRAWPSPWASFSCQTVLTTWDCGHSLTHLDPSTPPFQVLCPTGHPRSPSQVKFQGQSHGGLSGGQQGEDGEVTAVTGLWWCTRPCWRGDEGPILRPEVHHHNLEDHWAPGRNWKNKGEGAPEQEDDKEAA